MLSALTQLLIFQLTGEIIARGLNLPVPGPVIGMLLLFLMLMLRGGPSSELRTTSQTLLQHLSLLFVPAGAGIMVGTGIIITGTGIITAIAANNRFILDTLLF